jgi:acyl-CoA hydrolase
MENEIASNKRLTMTILMTPDLVNFAGNVHGGAILRYLDQAAYSCGRISHL